VKYLDRGDRGLTDGAASTVGFASYGLVPVTGPQALRARVMPLFADEPLRIPDFIGAGPDAPSDEAARGGSSPKIRVTS
jgi:hypothetical protein